MYRALEKRVSENFILPASVALSDARPTSDQVRSGNIFRRLIMNIFYDHSLPSADSRRAVVCQFQAKKMCTNTPPSILHKSIDIDLRRMLTGTG